MPLTFTRVDTVEAGDCITSDQAAQMADAFNDRILSGLGDPTWRIHHYFLNACRQIRLPNGSAWPTQTEALSFYAHIPEGTDWPVAGHEDPEGLSPASPLGAFVVGRDGTGNEYGRTSQVDPFYIDASPALPTTPAEKWDVGKQQRGGYDESAGVLDAPAFDAAQSIFTFQFGSSNTILQLEDDAVPPNTVGASAYDAQANPHGASYGAFFPEPERVSGEEHCEPSGDIRVNHEIKFTKISDSSETTFPGTCPPSSTNGSNSDVQAVYESPFEWLVVEYGGTLTRFSKDEYIEGPYTGWGRLAKDRGRQMERAMNLHMADFRGTSSQISSSEPEERCIDFDRLFAKQYRLSPAYAEWDAVGETLDEIYPVFSTSDDTPTTALGCDQGGTTWATHSGYGFTAYLAEVTNPTGEVVLEIKDGSTVLETVTIPAGTTSLIHWVETPHESVTIGVEVVSGTFDSVSIEILEQWLYTPQHHDAYLLMRLKATNNDSGADIDGDGREELDNVSWLTQHLAEGWLVMGARNVVDEDTLMSNSPVWQAFRRFANDRIRWIRRQEFNDYEFDGTDSILTFKRYISGEDAFAGIAPPTSNVTSGSIEAGVKYEVRGDPGDSITYNTIIYSDGDTFTGEEGFTDYTTNGFPSVREYEGIRTTARAGEWTNEWVVHLNLKAYSPSTSNTFYIENYSDHFPYADRCTLFSGGDTGQLASYIKSHFNDASFTSTNIGLLTPENPTGYRYLDTLNTQLGLGASTDEFAKSCPIYQRPYVIKSCTSFDSGGTEYVRIKIDGRIQSDENAPATIDDTTDIDDWTSSTIPYRTDENALWEYLQYPGTDCSELIGDVSGNEDLDHQDVEGSCVPTFHFTKLVEKPYDDGNDQAGSADTPLDVHWMIALEWYLRCMCEGYVDAETTEEHIDCTTLPPTGASEIYDFKYSNLLLQAGSLTTISPILLQSVEGFGPLPGQEALASMWNLYANAINLLTKVRIPLPSDLQVRTTDYDAIEAGSSWTEEAGTCGDTGRILRFVEVENQPLLELSLTSTSSWTTVATQFTAVSRQEITDTCTGGEFSIERTRGEVEYKWSPISTDLLHTIHPDVQDLLDERAVFLAEITEERHIPSIQEVLSDPDFSQGGTDYADTAPTDSSVYCKLTEGFDISTNVVASDLALYRASVSDPLQSWNAYHTKVVDVAGSQGTPMVDVPLV